MKADLVSVDAVGVERRPYGGPPAANRANAARSVLAGVGLATIAGGIVASALWFAWKLAEIVP